MGIKYTEVIPTDVCKGLRAFTVQSYTEANVKNGTQHEASALFSGLPGNAVNYTIFKTGSRPVSLKARHISYTGDGVQADIFRSPTYTGGTGNIPYQNSTQINPDPGESEIIISPVVTDEGTMAFASSFALGNSSNQGRGSSGVDLGNERILAPDTEYLLKLTSLDSGTQSISSLLYWYEGVLDLPVKAGEY